MPNRPAQVGSMWCPQCWSEYVPGLTSCADCDVPLVADVPLGVLEKERRSDRRWSVAAAVALMVVVPSVAFVAYGLVYWIHSVCGAGLGEFLAEQRQLRRDAAIVWTVAGSVFLVRAALARGRARSVWPWLALAAVMLAFATREALFAEPSQWCVF